MLCACWSAAAGCPACPSPRSLPVVENGDIHARCGPVRAQKAEDGPYLVKFLLNGSNGTPLRDMLRSVSRNLKHPTLSTKSSVVQPSTPRMRGSMTCDVSACSNASTLPEVHDSLSLPGC